MYSIVICYHFLHKVYDVIMEHNGDNEMDTYVYVLEN